MLYRAGMDAIALLDWLLECDVDALLRVDSQRTWTFHASGGDGGEQWRVRVDALSAEECLEKSLRALADHGLVPPRSLV